MQQNTNVGKRILLVHSSWKRLYLLSNSTRWRKCFLLDFAPFWIRINAAVPCELFLNHDLSFKLKSAKTLECEKINTLFKNFMYCKICLKDDSPLKDPGFVLVLNWKANESAMRRRRPSPRVLPSVSPWGRGGAAPTAQAQPVVQEGRAEPASQSSWR